MSLSKKLPVLPIEIVNKIFLYLQSPVAKIIKDEIEIYEEDHNWEYTKIYRYYLIKNIMSFDNYYFDKRLDPDLYKSFDDKMYREMLKNNVIENEKNYAEDYKDEEDEEN